MKYFGTDGFRGEANKELTAEHALKVGQYLGWYFGERLRIKASCVIGKDTRRSSYMLEYALAAGVASSGADVNLMHVTTTPSVSYIARTCGFDFGIMVTASHNPLLSAGKINTRSVLPHHSLNMLIFQLQPPNLLKPGFYRRRPCRSAQLSAY